MLQVADYVCTLELTAIKFEGHEEGTTDKRFFGSWGSFKKNYLRKIRNRRSTAFGCSGKLRAVAPVASVIFSRKEKENPFF